MAKYSDQISAIFDQAEGQGNYLEPVQIRPVTPKQEPAPQPETEDRSILKDAAGLWGVGSNQLVQGLGWLFNSEEMQELGQSGQEYWQNTLSETQKQANQKRFVNDDWSLGEGATDLNTYFGLAVQSLPHMVPGMGAAGAVAKGAQIAGASKGVASLLAAGAGSAGEGVTIGAMVGSDVDQSIRGMTEEQKMQSPYYSDLRKMYDEEEATSRLSRMAANPAALQSGAVGAALGVAFNKFLGDALTGRLSGGPIRGAVKGGIIEGGTETLQSGAESYSRQDALNEYAAQPMSYTDLVNEMVTGLAAGATMGVGVGGAGGLASRNQEPEQAPQLSEQAQQARDDITAAGGDALDATNAASETIASGLNRPVYRDTPNQDIGGLIAQAQQQAQALDSGASDADLARVAPDLWAPSTTPRPYDISAMGRDLSQPVQQSAPLSSQFTDEIQGPEVVYQQDGVTVTRGENNQLEARQDGSELVAFGEDVGDARRKLTRLIERNTKQAPVLQNRDRSGRGYIDQMDRIASQPDYDQVSTSRTPEAGAPMVFAQGDAPTVSELDMGRSEAITMSDGKGGDRKIQARYAVVEASDLKASHGADGTKNEGYGSDGLIALNNGRTAGLQEAYNRGTAQGYRESMLADVAQTGITAEAINSKTNPVLIRLFDGQQLEGIDDPGAASNVNRGADLSLSERAQTDARKLTPDVLAKLRSGDPLSSDNSDFVASAIEAISSGEANTAMRDSKGLLTAEGQKRLRGALIERAFTDKTLTNELVEATDSDLKTFGDALAEVAGRWALMREKARDGSINPDMDITDALTGAINMIRKSRQEGVSLKDLASQVDAFAGEADQMAVHILSLFYRGAKYNRARPKQAISDALLNYTNTALQSAPDADMFGNITTPDQVLERERGRLEGEQQEESASGVQPDGADNRTGGQEGQGSGDRDSGAQDAEEGAAPEVEPERRKDAQGRRRVNEMTDEEMRKALLEDDLTGLGNRRAYAENERKPVQVSADADSLKWINDNMSHGAGDQMLEAIGRAFKAQGADAYHPSGDEFWMQADTEQEAERIMQAVASDLEGAMIEFETPDGEIITKRGIGLSYGTADTIENAEQRLQENKAEREQAGQRSGRGETPPGVTRSDARVSNDATEGQQNTERDSAERQEELNPDTGDIRFSRTGPRNLFVAHNLSESNLEHVLELGGLAAPSLAVGRSDQGFGDFGEITLLAESSILESSKARTFDADVYTPRHPRAEYEIDRDAYVRQRDSLDNEYDLRVPDPSDLENGGMEDMARSPAYQYSWLKSKGRAPKPKRMKVDPVIRQIAKLGLSRWDAKNDPRVIKLADKHYQEIRRQYIEVTGEDTARANVYWEEDGTLKASVIDEVIRKVERYKESGGYDTAVLQHDLQKKMRSKLNQRQYESWIKDRFNEVVKSQRMFDGFTPSGNRRYKPYNLDGIVKVMTRKLQGGEGFNYGAGSVRSAYAKEFKRVSQVQANRDRIVSAEEMDSIKDESNNRLQEVLDELKGYYKYDADGWGYTNDASSAIAEGPKGWNEAFDLDAEGRAIITEFTNYLKELPTAYFETKVGRAVDLSEFSVALVPKGTNMEAVKALRDKGLTVKRYDPADPDSRRQEIAKQEDLLFSRDGEFRRTPGQATPTLTAAQATAITDELLQGWKGKPDVISVDRISDFPKPLRDAIRLAGAEGDMRGVFFDNKVYILAPRIPSRAALEEVVLHEVVGHYGLRKMMGAELKPLLNQVYLKFARTDAAKEIIRNYYPDGDFNPANSNDRLTVAEELLAHLAETGKHQKLWNKIVAAVREGLRKLGFTLDMTEADLLGILAGAQKVVERGGISLAPSEAVAMSRAGRSGSDRTAWPSEFPRVPFAAPLGAADKHPRYQAAKSGDVEAAQELVSDIVDEAAIERIKKMIGDSRPLVLPAFAEEATGRNMIPVAYAAKIAKSLDLTVDQEIIQSVSVKRTGEGADYRLANHAVFDGEVLPGQDYLIVDDTLTMGGTLASLRGHIEAGGGNVVGATTLTGFGKEGTLALTEKMSQDLWRKHGAPLNEYLKEEFGYGIDSLTQGEAGHFRKAESLERIRERIDAARIEIGSNPVDGIAPDSEPPQDSPDIRFSRTGNSLDPAASHFTDLSDAERSALGKIAPRTPKEKASDWWSERSDRWQTKIRQGAVDRFAALKDLDETAYGKDVVENSTASSSWVLSQMSGAASGALQSMLTSGRIKLNASQKVIDMQDGTRGLNDVLKDLGTAAEIERFFGWIAGNRSRRLMAEGRENLFTPEEVEALSGLDRGTAESGESRKQLYAKVFREFQKHRDDVLSIAEGAGIITAEQRETWANEFYVPFYRLAESDGGFTGPKASGGITRQEAYKKLKGGKENLNDLLENTMMNFHHLLQASLKNQAAMQAMDNAETMAIAREVRESARDTENSTFVLRDGQKVWYEIDDPLVFKAVTALAHPGMNSSAMKVMRSFKRLFTNLTTTTPQFVVANLLRDSMQASATSEVSKNFLKNMAEGSKAYGDKRTRARMMATGGAFSFGHLYGENADEMRLQITGGLARADVLRNPSMIPDAIRGTWRKWNEVTDFTENINRAAIFEANREEKGELYAAFKSRDLMNFSQHGAWPAMRILIDVVPFLNARIQGLDKIYRSGVKPGLAVAMGKGTATDKEAAARFWSVTGALALASIALYLANKDDEEYKKLEEWQKDTYWFLRISDDHAIFIPKPFEVGAIATLVERMTEQAVSDTATGELFAERLGHMMMSTFSFSPVPQMAQPALDVYANYDAFTGRPIEGMGMDRLSPELRRRVNTTAPAIAGSYITGAIAELWGGEGYSPVQMDHLIRGYFGSIGAWGAGVADTIWKTANGEEAPATYWYENQPVRRFYKNLGDEDRYTRYGTVFYNALRETNRIYADIQEHMQLGEVERARELISENRATLASRKLLNRAQRRLSEINKAMEKVRRSGKDSEYQRRELDRLRGMKNALQKAIGERVEQASSASSR